VGQVETVARRGATRRDGGGWRPGRDGDGELWSGELRHWWVVAAEAPESGEAVRARRSAGVEKNGSD
jgi:hypothetical protein